MSTPPPSTADWVRWMARPVGRAERERAALHVLDWMACASAGSRTEPGLAMGRFARTLTPGPCATFAGPSLSEGDAALVNGSLGNVLEMDDFYRTAIVHPGPVLVPAALAMAQASGATGPQMLDALVKGFDIMIRLGRSVGPAHYRYFHNTATCGVFGAAAIGAALLELQASAMRDAFGNAGTQASGLWQCRLEDSMSKQLHNGRAAQSGLLAVRLAQHGFTGAHAILEGELGFFRAMCPDAQPDRMAGGDEDRWLIHDTSFKPWPACRHAHAVIDLALALRDAVGGAEIATIDVHSYRDAVRQLYLSALLSLHERNLITYQPSDTNREVLTAIRNQPHLYQQLQPVIATFDDVWYGVHEPDRTTFDSYVVAVEELEGKP